MKNLVRTGALILAFLLPALALAQVTGGTGKLGFQLRNYGAVRMYTPNYDIGDRQIDRFSFVAALDSADVYDHEQDANTVEDASLLTTDIADTVATVLADNSYSGLPPNVQVRTTVYAWHDDSFFIVKLTVKNIDTNQTTYPLYLGAFVVPKPDNAYGGETMAYDTAKKVGYYHREGGTAFVGFKVLSGAPSSFHSRDWDVYSPDPDNDLATDSMRWQMTAVPGFDSALIAGGDGGALNLNAGLRTIAPGDSASVYYSVIYTESFPGMLLQADSAQLRYVKAFVPPTASYDIAKLWNIVSVPQRPADPRKVQLFPTAVSSAFAFDPDSGYVQRDTLMHGTGYWLKFSAAQSVDITGRLVLLDTIAVKSGWNLIGSVAVPVAASSMVRSARPSGRLFSSTTTGTRPPTPSVPEAGTG